MLGYNPVIQVTSQLILTVWGGRRTHQGSSLVLGSNEWLEFILGWMTTWTVKVGIKQVHENAQKSSYRILINGYCDRTMWWENRQVLWPGINLRWHPKLTSSCLHLLSACHTAGNIWTQNDLSRAHKVLSFSLILMWGVDLIELIRPPEECS